MFFERSRAIERRLEDVLRLIHAGWFSTPMLAEEIGVSVPTISHRISALRERGYDIRAERCGNSWHYTLFSTGEPGRSRAPTRGHGMSESALRSCLR
jgi:biotin operon repressor